MPTVPSSPPQPSGSPTAAAAVGLGVPGAANVAGATLAGTLPAVLAAKIGEAGTVLTAKVIADITKRVIRGLDTFSRRRERDSAHFVLATLMSRYPQIPRAELERILKREVEFERTFRAKMADRLQHDLPLALRTGDVGDRIAAVQRVFDREKRYTIMREEAMLARAVGRVEAVILQDSSPEGAYWKLSPHVKQHTLDCIAMGEKFWPWSAIEAFHPPLHPGCACTLHSFGHAVGQGWMAPDQIPDEQDALNRVASIRQQFGHIEEALSVERLIDGLPLEEVELRWPKGVHYGGEFRPKAGGDPGALVRRLLHPHHHHETPLQRRARARGRWTWIRGMHTHVPEADHWERHIGGLVYRSPAGSTNVYRDGKLISTPGEHAPEERRKRPPMLHGTLDEDKLATVEQLRQTRRAGRGEIKRGDGPEALMALHQNHYALEGTKRWRRGSKLQFFNQNTGARVIVNWDGQKVAKVTWETEPRRSAPRRLSEGPPRSWRDHVADALAWADEVGRRFNADVQVPDFSTERKLADHAGTHEWDGRVNIGNEAPDDIEAAARARAAGRDLTESEKRGVWSTYWVTAHEVVGHGVNPPDQLTYEGAGANLEEALAEEIAHIYAVERLQEQGQDDVLKWREQHQDTVPVRGNYNQERHALAGLFDQAGVTDPARRRRLVEQLAFETPPASRFDYLAHLLHGKHPERSLEDWRDHAELAMENRPAVGDVEAHGVLPFRSSSRGRQQTRAAYGRMKGRGRLSSDATVLRTTNGTRRVEKLPLIDGVAGLTDGTAITNYPPGQTFTDGLEYSDGTPKNFRYVDTPERAKMIMRAWMGQGSPGTTPASPGDQGSFWDDIESGGHFPAKWLQHLGLGKGESHGAGKGPKPKKKPKPPKPEFIGGDKTAPLEDGPVPNYDRTRLKLGKGAGGSNGARWASDKSGRRWLVKSYRGDQDRVATELAANAIYRDLGAKVAEAGVIHKEGKPVLAYPALDGKVRQYVFQDKGPNEDVGRHYMLDALLANWDFAGMTDDNIIWDEQGKPIRVDQGGTMEYRAQGQKKPFGPLPTEVWTMIRKGQGKRASKVTEDQMREQAAEIAKKLTPSKIDEILNAAPFADEEMRERVKEALKARVDWMDRFAKGKEGLPEPVEGADLRDDLEAAQKDFRVLPKEEEALHALIEDGAVQQHLRSGGTPQQASPETKKTVKALDGLLRDLKTDDDAYVYIGFDSGDPKKLVGARLHEKGYLGATTDEQLARQHGAVLRLLVPAGSHMAYTPSLLPEDTPGGPDVVLPRGQRLKIDRLREVDGVPYLEAVLA